MNNSDLNELVKKVSQEYFGKPFIHQAYFNVRLKTTGGRFHLKDRNIDINPKIYQQFGYDTLVGVIKHELCHYHLYNDGLPAQHRDHSFKILLKQVGGLRYSPIQGQTKKKTYHLYQCVKCQTQYVCVRRIDTKRFVCGKCHGRLEYLRDIK